MKALRKGLVVVLLCLGSGILFGQAANDYRTAGNGTWSTVSVWQRYSGSVWEAASVAPDSNVGAIAIDSGHTVTIASDLGVDSLTVHGYGTLVINSGVTVTVAYNNDAIGIDVDTLGTVTVNGTIVCQGRVGGADSSVVFNDGSFYDHARNGGSVPRSNWKTGSTIILTGVTANSPSNMSQNFYHLILDIPVMTANLNMGMSGNTIRGDITVLQTGATQRYYLTSPTSYVDPITILGDVRVVGGQFSSNGSSSAASIVVHTYGDVIVTGGNFGCSRGSAPSVSWYLHGDTMAVSNATLQNSTSSPANIQKFIFAKQGTQYLRWSNVTYGGSGTSPITLQVSGGTTLDIDTTVIPNGNTGSFILDSAATLVSAHNGVGNEGTIDCLADFGGGNSFVKLNAMAGTGTVSVKAFKGPHPNIYDTSKTLHRYWNVTADPGITQATMVFYYYDLDPVGTEVRGTEASYKALRYSGAGTGWYTEAGATVDALFDFVTAAGVTAVTGIWTVGEAAPPVSVPAGEPPVPKSFFVDQNYPNPFNPTTTIVYGLPFDGYVTARVYNMLGQEVTTLFDGKQAAGTHRLTFDASHLPTGVYIYTVKSGVIEISKQMVLVK